MDKNQDIILVTGGGGSIGSVLVHQLLCKDRKVRVLDSLLFGERSLRPFLSEENFEFVHGDIREPSDIKEALDGVNSVVHLAAIVGEPASNSNQQLTIETNKNGSELLYQMALENNVEKFIFASTCSNYGEVSSDGEFVDEKTVLQPLSVYSETKVGFENFLFAAKSEKLSPTILRFATAYGMSFRPRFDLTVNQFCKDLIDKKTLEIYGERFWRPYCHTTDLAQACIMILDNTKELTGGKVFNVGATTENYQKKDIIKMILEELPEAEDLVSYGGGAPDNRNYRVSFDKIKEELNFEIKIKLSEGISEVISALKSGYLSDYEEQFFHNVKI